MTKSAFMAHEKQYWDETTPIGFVFAFGSIMGLAVGGVLVYQILFADISAHLPEYATLKAMGYTTRQAAPTAPAQCYSGRTGFRGFSGKTSSVHPE